MIITDTHLMAPVKTASLENGQETLSMSDIRDTQILAHLHVDLMGLMNPEADGLMPGSPHINDDCSGICICY